MNKDNQTQSDIAIKIDNQLHPDTSHLCQSCNKNDADSDHTCPYAEDIDGDSETLCNCCSECTNNCAQDI